MDEDPLTMIDKAIDLIVGVIESCDTTAEVSDADAAIMYLRHLKKVREYHENL